MTELRSVDWAALPPHSITTIPDCGAATQRICVLRIKGETAEAFRQRVEAVRTPYDTVEIHKTDIIDRVYLIRPVKHS